MFNSFLILHHKEGGMDLSVAYTQASICINYDSLVEVKRTPKLVLTETPVPGQPVPSGFTSAAGTSEDRRQ